jgi:hypothetical protein
VVWDAIAVESHEWRAIGKPGLRRDGRPAMRAASGFLVIGK